MLLTLCVAGDFLLAQGLHAMTQRTYLPVYEELRKKRWADQGHRNREFSDPIRDLREPRARAAREARAKIYQLSASGVVDVQEKCVLLPHQMDGPALCIRYTIVRPISPSAKKSCVVFLHGGALVGSTRHVGLEVNGPLWAEYLDAITISIEYERPPLNRDEGPATECYQMLLWVWRNRLQLGIQEDKIVLYGASAGGGLAAAVGLMLRRDLWEGKQDLPRLAGIFLEAPMLEDRDLGGRWEEFFDGPFFSSPESRLGWTALLGDRAGTEAGVTQYEAPGRATNLTDFGLGCPVYVEAAGEDMFFQEDMRFATKLLAAGVDVEFGVYLGCPHGFAAMCPDEKISREAIEKRLEWMMRILALV